MALKAILATLDEVDEKYHDLYTERDGKFYLNPIEGMKSEADVQRLQTALTKERNDHKATKGKLDAFGELNADEVLAKLDRIEELEAAAGGKLDETKINELVETRIKSRTAPLERQLETLKTQNATLASENENFVQQGRTRTINDALRSVATELKVIPEALDDVLLYAPHFEINDLGSVVTKDSTGMAGLDAKAWLMNNQAKKPHWFPATEGAGTRSRAGGSAGNNPWSKSTFNLTEQGRITRENPQLAEQLQRSAVN